MCKSKLPEAFITNYCNIRTAFSQWTVGSGYPVNAASNTIVSPTRVDMSAGPWSIVAGVPMHSESIHRDDEHDIVTGVPPLIQTWAIQVIGPSSSGFMSIIWRMLQPLSTST